MLSPLLRPKVAYPKLSPEEIEETVAEVDELIAWLSDRQLRDQDFIRQAIIDGMKQFKFRLERIGWLGWGYTVSSLRDVVGAYLALERGTASEVNSPDNGAVLKKVLGTLQHIYAKAVTAKEGYETADFLLKMYGVAALTAQSIGSVAGFLSPPTS